MEKNMSRSPDLKRSRLELKHEEDIHIIQTTDHSGPVIHINVSHHVHTVKSDK